MQPHAADRGESRPTWALIEQRVCLPAASGNPARAAQLLFLSGQGACFDPQQSESKKGGERSPEAMGGTWDTGTSIARNMRGLQ